MKLILTLLFGLYIFNCLAQTEKKQSNVQNQLQSRVTAFLKWYKTLANDTTKHDYRLITGGYPDTTVRQRVDKEGVEKYLQIFTRSGYVSEGFTDGFRNYFMRIDAKLVKMKNPNGMSKIGMDGDLMLQDLEPDEIFNQIDKSTVKQCYVIRNKAIISLHVTPYVTMLFTLTQNNQGSWLIDYVGYDEPQPRSFFNQ